LKRNKRKVILQTTKEGSRLFFVFVFVYPEKDLELVPFVHEASLIYSLVCLFSKGPYSKRVHERFFLLFRNWPCLLFQVISVFLSDSLLLPISCCFTFGFSPLWTILKKLGFIFALHQFRFVCSAGVVKLILVVFWL
jgi:hypothetical protein